MSRWPKRNALNRPAQVVGVSNGIEVYPPQAMTGAPRTCHLMLMPRHPLNRPSKNHRGLSESPVQSAKKSFTDFAAKRFYACWFYRCMVALGTTFSSSPLNSGGFLERMGAFNRLLNQQSPAGPEIVSSYSSSWLK